MTKPLLIIFNLFVLISCGPTKMKTPTNAMDKFEEFKEKVKYVEDSKLFYPGIMDESMRPILTNKINLVADDFKAVSLSENPTDEKYHKAIKTGLKRFADIYVKLDTEDRERTCSYFEELMDIVDLESSDGQLNNFMYGFDPTE